MNPNERRRIVWGPGEHANLDPFVVDVSGRVFHGNADEPIKAIDRKDAAKAWNQHGDGSKRFEVDPGETNLRGPRLRHLKPEELVRAYSDELLLDVRTDEVEHAPAFATRWCYLQLATDPSAVWKNRDDPPPVVLLDEPPEWLPLKGNADDGWVAPRARGTFRTVFHGPSVAAWLFNTGDNSSTR